MKPVDVTIPEILTKPRFCMHARLVDNLTEPAELHKPKKRIKNAELSFANSAANYPKHSFKKTTHITLSSAAAFKLRLCGILLRSKTTKLRLKSCPRSEATDAATPC